MNLVYAAEAHGFSAVGAAHGRDNRAHGALLQPIFQSLCRIPQMRRDVPRAPELQTPGDIMLGNDILGCSIQANVLVVFPVR